MSVFFEKEECVDLPPITYSKYSCAMDVEQQKYYDDIKHQFFTKIDNMCELCNKKGKCLSLCDKTVSIKNAISAITKLQQVACGFYMNRVTNVSDDGKETIDKNIITFKSNPKLRLLIETLNNIPHNRKVIIWSNLIHSIDLIDEAIKKSGLGQSLLIYQNIDAFDQVEEFKDPKYRYLIANPSKAGAGLNIQFDNSNYQVFYSCNYSYIMRTQAEGRQHRKGQKNIVTVIDLYCKDSIDETILQALAEKEELSETLVSAAKLTQILKGNKLIKA
jgi:SNF2 family DNA or RNA helicase